MSYEKYYENQCGHGDYYRGVRYQKGHGLGNVLGGLLRASLPFLKRTALGVGKDLLSTGVSQTGKVVRDVLNGRPVVQSLKQRSLEGGQQLVNKRLKVHKRKRTLKRQIKRRPATKTKRSKDIFA